MTERSYDVVVIGAGPVGENVADYVHRAGLSAAIVEGELVGGECSYWACIPSKALLRPDAALRAAHAVGGAAEAVGERVDVPAVLARRDRFTGRGDDSGQVSWLEGAGIDLVRGHGRLAGERRVEVTSGDGRTLILTAEHAVAIATGSDAAVPSIPGLDGIEAWTSREATTAERIPSSVAIVGGGVVAAEMATAYSALGASVTVVVRSRLLSRLEDIAGDAVAKRLTENGARIVTAEVRSASRSGDMITLALDDGSAVDVETVIVAAGRTPRTGDIGLESVGLEPGSWIDVDDTLRVPGVAWLYAAGDVNHRALLTHQGKYQARAAAAAIVARAVGSEPDTSPWSDAVATADHAAVPSVVFSSPEVASVGLTSREAERRGLDVRVVDLPLTDAAGTALHADDYEGTLRAVVDVGRGVLVGATFVGDDTAELLHAATIAVVGEVPLDRLWHAVPAFPTMSEIWLRLLERLRNG